MQKLVCHVFHWRIYYLVEICVDSCWRAFLEVPEEHMSFFSKLISGIEGYHRGSQGFHRPYWKFTFYKGLTFLLPKFFLYDFLVNQQIIPALRNFTSSATYSYYFCPCKMYNATADDPTGK